MTDINAIINCLIIITVIISVTITIILALHRHYIEKRRKELELALLRRNSSYSEDTVKTIEKDMKRVIKESKKSK
jgi:hypothetical protein